MTYTCDTLLQADMLVTQNDTREVITDAAIAITGGTILAVGTQSQLFAYSAKQTIRLPHALLMPGLINAHTHVAMTYLRGLADDMPLMEWLSHYVFPIEKHLSEEIVELATMLGCAEMIRTGTTAFADMYLMEKTVLRAVKISKMRALLGEVIFAFPSPAYSCVEEGFALVRDLAAAVRTNDRIRTAVMPHSVYTTTPEIMRTCRDLAQELAVPLHIHLAETVTETATCLEQYGKRPVAYCHDCGLLGTQTTLAHGVDLTDEELDLLRSTGTHVAHNPKSNMKLASGVARIDAMLARGMLPGLGTDGAASNNSLNMFLEMSACALLHKVHTLDPTAVPAQTVLDMATLGSAAASGWHEAGRLVPGAPADIIALDTTSPNLQPLYSPAPHLVYAASGHEVCFSMVGGTVLYQDGKFTTLDYDMLLKEMPKVKKWVKKSMESC